LLLFHIQAVVLEMALVQDVATFAFYICAIASSVAIAGTIIVGCISKPRKLWLPVFTDNVPEAALTLQNARMQLLGGQLRTREERRNRESGAWAAVAKFVRLSFTRRVSYVEYHIPSHLPIRF
jgi:uncharacterized membrane protein YdfJ with MMPL/SSD domain